MNVFAALGAVVAASLMLGGCSGSSDHPTTSTSSAVSAEAAGKALADAKTAVAGASTAHLEGQFGQGAKALVLKLDIGMKGATGTLQAGGGTATAVATPGDLYLKGDVAFWKVFEGGQHPVLAGSWVRVSAATSPVFGDVLDMVPIELWLNHLAPADQKLSGLPGKTIDGTATIGVRSTAADSAEIYVSTGKPAYPVLVVPAGGGNLRLSRWNEQVPEVKAPSGKVLDATRTALSG